MLRQTLIRRIDREQFSAGILTNKDTYLAIGLVLSLDKFSGMDVVTILAWHLVIDFCDTDDRLTAVPTTAAMSITVGYDVPAGVDVSLEYTHVGW